MNERSAQRTIAQPFGARLDTLRGEPTLAAGVLVTPIARRLALWWLGGGWIYAWPSAVEYPEGTLTRRLRILPIQPLVSAAVVAVGVAALGAVTTQRWRRQQSARNTARKRWSGQAAPRQRRGRRTI